jgi:hypothetical protein
MKIDRVAKQMLHRDETIKGRMFLLVLFNIMENTNYEFNDDAAGGHEGTRHKTKTILSCFEAKVAFPKCVSDFRG